MNSKNLLLPIRFYLLFAFTLLILSTLAQAQDSSPSETQNNDQKQTEMASLSKEINESTEEIKELSLALKSATGEEYDAIQLRLYQKNMALRASIETAIDEEVFEPKVLQQMVKGQANYTERAMTYIEGKFLEKVNEINTAELDAKLSLLPGYKELHEFFDLMYRWSWQNEQWRQKLGIAKPKTVEVLKEKYEIRMDLVSASIDYLMQQQKTVSTQLSQSPESEKASFQLQKLINDQRLDIAVNSLRQLSSDAAEMGMKTAEYRQLIFKATGSITHDLLDFEVLWGILVSASKSVFNWLSENAADVFFKILIFILVLFIAHPVAKLTRRVVGKTVASKNLNFSQLMQDFFISISSKTVWVIAILIGLSQIGINLAPVLTGFGIAGVIIGLALQDSLSNLAAGMMLLIYRPFDVGDFVHAGGVDGKVNKMSLVNTTIRTFDNQIIIVPNNKIWGDVIKNVTHERTRRVDMVFGIGYNDDLLKAEQILIDIATSHPAVLPVPETMVKLHTLNTSSVDFIVRPWVKTDDYWDVYWDVTKEVKLRFDREGISIPFPQQDVHLHMVKGNKENDQLKRIRLSDEPKLDKNEQQQNDEKS
ncbi:mechanosensitive ion channel domain-containing protein [Thalassotalea aquiviva]|uniref:mechanosensitive ion channel domain-containing protein n=1 Tax=Thalassotalea aquiviva TaxID=3242415 RepID=UPI00352B9CBD